MSNVALTEAAIDCEFEHFYSQAYQHISTREQVSEALKAASAAFAAQVSQPDGYKYIDACRQLGEFLEVKTVLDRSEQQLLTQVLQVACAVHENAINNPTLTLTERSSHQLASKTFYDLCSNALDRSIFHTDLWCEVFCLSARADKSLAKAMEALDLSKYFNTGNKEDDWEALFSPLPNPSVADATQTPRFTTIKEKAIAMLDDRPSPSKTLPLGRSHSMPAVLSISQSMSSSRPKVLHRGLEQIKE